MSELREGTPQEFAGLLGAARDAQQQEPANQEGDEQQQGGDTEFNTFGAREPSALIRAMHPPTESEPKAAVTDADADRTEAARLLALNPELARLLKGDTVQELVGDAAELAATLDGLRRKEEEAQAKPVSFDGGVRQSTPAPSDPITEHNSFLLDIFGKPGGTGGW